MKQEIFEYKSVEYVIEIGQNKRDNFDIIDSSCGTDIWFHVEGMPSCHVILKTYEKMSYIPHQVIKRCAYLCKINSKAKTQPKCDISYTTINNITKTDILGQVHIKNYKTVCV
jgi:predicted ribosome quality control (RQC) complex YloA/Tae2 family protein